MNAAFFPLTGSARPVGLLSRILRRRALRRPQRGALAELSPGHLRDLGLTAAEAQPEPERPVWDVPVYWLR